MELSLFWGKLSAKILDVDDKTTTTESSLDRYDWTISFGSMSSCSIYISASHPQITIDVRIIMKKELIIL